ncbi:MULTISPECIES: aminotransferase class IV [unclassified Cyanobium]|uniref:aminotransferase class IV n=1 Tax=unclassified Cyanobium TaxID=2627006 RepID=UPI0020CDECF0|nr:MULTISPECIES: aminotransferase class IV [unclassified Cyanobium]MCP9776573.1 aminotransferase class IV [Cyanobium sp. Tous-M-B4]MCP9877776.1 aminotransferase class IV [Cyanobium sp. A2C-AMD]
MSAPIAWLGDGTGQGRWGTPQTLTLPISDRGLLLADGLFETLLVEAGQAWLLGEHLGRWQSSAALLGLPPPPGAATVQPLIAAAIERSGIGKAPGSSGALRLNWSRGSGARGIDPPCINSPSFWLQLSAFKPCFEPVRVIVSATETRSATSLLSRCKSFAYGASIQARRQALEAGADDALLASSAGGLCCGTSANLLVCSGGSWITPPLSSGCLPGVMRQRGLDRGLITEAPVNEQDLASWEAAMLINSLGCRPISHLGALPIANSAPSGGGNQKPETFWRQLLQASP